MNAIRKPDWPLKAADAVKYNLVTKLLGEDQLLEASASVSRNSEDEPHGLGNNRLRKIRIRRNLPR